MESEFNNIFEEEYKNVAGEKIFISLSDVLKISLLDDNNEFKINFAHIHDDKDGRFTKENFSSLSQVYQLKEKVYKRYEFRSQLQAHFTLLMWKQVCSREGEIIFTDWIRNLLLKAQSEIEIDESEDDINPDPSKYMGRQVVRLLYEILNVKLTHGIDFQYFFDLMQVVSENMDIGEDMEGLEDYIHITIIDYFCTNFIRGFSKLILDLGFDNFLLDDIE